MKAPKPNRPALAPSLLLLIGMQGLLGMHSPLFADIITVETTEDELNSNASCSLREAIKAANEDLQYPGCSRGLGSDLILVPAGTYTLSIAPSGANGVESGDLQLTDEVDIVGIGEVIIDGAGIDRLFEIKPSAQQVEMTNLTLRNGDSSGNGGAIRAHESVSLFLTDVDMLNNQGLTGGALEVARADPGGTTASPVLDFTDVVIAGNSASQEGGAVWWRNRGAGAQWNCLRCSITDNEGTSGAGAILVHADDFATLRFDDSEILDNSTSDTSGGGIEIGPTATVAVHFDDVELHGNAGVGQLEDGFYSRSPTATLFTTGGSISDLIVFASGGGAILDGTTFGASSFGALWSFEDTTVEIYDSVFELASGKPALDLGPGSSALIIGSRFQGNLRGAIDCDDCILDVRQTGFADNIRASGVGGAVNVEGMVAEATFRNVTFSGNAASTGSGGALALTEGADFLLNNVTITDNVAASAGGLFVGGQAAPPEISNSIVAGNHLSGGSGSDCGGTLLSIGYNVVGIKDGCVYISTAGDQSGTAGNPLDPGLRPMVMVAGLPTHGLEVGSPALDHGNDAWCEAIDQVGQVRPLDGGSGAICDVGAREEPNPWDPLIFADGFESGDLSHW